MAFTGQWQRARPRAGPLIDSAQDAGYPGELVGANPSHTLFPYPPGTGPNGDGGAKNYIRSGRMTSGFALIAWPATFESSGIMTFIVGDVYQKDLGPDTTHVASGITRFDPDLTWARVAVTND